MPEVVVVALVLGRWRKSFCEGESDGVCGAAPVFLALNCDFARKLGLFGCDAHENNGGTTLLIKSITCGIIDESLLSKCCRTCQRVNLARQTFT
jgi:hypothetical protein